MTAQIQDKQKKNRHSNVERIKAHKASTLHKELQSSPGVGELVYS